MAAPTARAREASCTGCGSSLAPPATRHEVDGDLLCKGCYLARPLHRPVDTGRKVILWSVGGAGLVGVAVLALVFSGRGEPAAPQKRAAAAPPAGTDPVPPSLPPSSQPAIAPQDGGWSGKLGEVQIRFTVHGGGTAVKDVHLVAGFAHPRGVGVAAVNFPGSVPLRADGQFVTTDAAGSKVLGSFNGPAEARGTAWLTVNFDDPIPGQPGIPRQARKLVTAPWTARPAAAGPPPAAPPPKPAEVSKPSGTGATEVQPIGATVNARQGQVVTWKGRVGKDGVIESREGSTTYRITMKLKEGALPPANTEVVFTGVLSRDVMRGQDFAYGADGRRTVLTTVYLKVNEARIVSPRK